MDYSRENETKLREMEILDVSTFQYSPSRLAFQDHEERNLGLKNALQEMLKNSPRRNVIAAELAESVLGNQVEVVGWDSGYQEIRVVDPVLKEKLRSSTITDNSTLFSHVWKQIQEKFTSQSEIRGGEGFFAGQVSNQYPWSSYLELFHPNETYLRKAQTLFPENSTRLGTKSEVILMQLGGYQFRGDIINEILNKAFAIEGYLFEDQSAEFKALQLKSPLMQSPSFLNKRIIAGHLTYTDRTNILINKAPLKARIFVTLGMDEQTFKHSYSRGSSHALTRRTEIDPNVIIECTLPRGQKNELEFAYSDQYISFLQNSRKMIMAQIQKRIK